MRTQLRVAERQGLLKGYHISRVQFYALSVLELLDQVERADNRDRELRMSLMQRGYMDAEDAFPELTTVTDDAAPLNPQVDKEGNAVSTKYVFSNAVYDPEKVQEEIRWMLEEAAKAEASFEQPKFT